MNKPCNCGSSLTYDASRGYRRASASRSVPSTSSRWTIPNSTESAEVSVASACSASARERLAVAIWASSTSLLRTLQEKKICRARMEMQTSPTKTLAKTRTLTRLALEEPVVSSEGVIYIDSIVVL